MTGMLNEDTYLLQQDGHDANGHTMTRTSLRRADEPLRHNHKLFRILIPLVTTCCCSLLFFVYRSQSTSIYHPSKSQVSSLPLLGKTHNQTKKQRVKDLLHIAWPKPIHRCQYVIDEFDRKNKRVAGQELREKYMMQSVDVTIFYRATAGIFWRDFGSASYKNQSSHWTQPDFRGTLIQHQMLAGALISLKSTWTWITGDQHLSNFGAWRNRHGDVVFGVNDFDEGAIYDFQIDVLRAAVSIANHAYTIGFKPKTINRFIRSFGNSYVQSVMSYIGNEKAALFELTAATTSKGKLHKFLDGIESGDSNEGLILKFTEMDNATGTRRFIKGNNSHEPDPDTSLIPVSPDVAAQIRAAMTITKYGATRMKLGWKVRPWDDDFFSVVDIGKRIGSGIGSYGLDRYYILLKGTDGLLEPHGVDGSAVILDVKFQPPGAGAAVLTDEDEAWYQNLFPNQAARVVEAQSRLTSYTDPYLGWFILTDKEGRPCPFSVRQRSPWKSSLDLNQLTDQSDFEMFVKQIAIATATAHVRGSVAKAPADFKSVIGSILGQSTIRKAWTRFLAGLAVSYRQQVLLDYHCFRAHVKEMYGNITV